jgi:hypothetical protein
MGLFDAIGDAFNAVEHAASSVVDGVENAVGTVVGAPVHLIQEGLQEAYNGLATGAGDMFDVLKDGGSFMWEAMKKAPEGLLHEAEAFPGQLWGFAKGFGEDAVQGAEGLYDSLKEIL